MMKLKFTWERREKMSTKKSTSAARLLKFVHFIEMVILYLPGKGMYNIYILFMFILSRSRRKKKYMYEGKNNQNDQTQIKSFYRKVWQNTVTVPVSMINLSIYTHPISWAKLNMKFKLLQYCWLRNAISKSSRSLNKT